MMKAINFLFGTNIKQNRYLLLSWIILLTGLFGGIAFYFNSLFGTQAEINSIGETMQSPAMVSMFGAFPPEQFETTAGLLAGMLSVFMGIFMVILNIQLAVNGSRKQEDGGLLELVRSRAVGRRAPTIAAGLLLIVTNGLLGIAYFVLLELAKLKGANLEGNLLLAALLASVGLMFGLLTLLLAQIANDTRQTYLLSFLIFGSSYLVRMMTDVTDPDFSWLSPLGWLTKADVFVANRWLPVLLLLGTGFLCGGLALVLVGRRDLDQGLLPERKGRKQGGRFLRSPLGLIFRLERNMIIGWAVGMLVLGAGYGSVFNSIGDILKINPTYEQMLGVNAVHSANKTIILNYVNLLAIIFSLLGIVCGGMILYNLKKHEEKGYLEVLHAKAVSRKKLFFSYYFVAIIAGLICLGSAVLGMALAGNLNLTEKLDAGYFWQTFGVNSLVLVTFLGLGAFLVGRLPKMTAVLWGYLMLGFVCCYFLPLLDFSEDWRKISPLGWTDKVPVDSLSTHWLVIMSLSTLLLTILGWLGYQKRDVQGGI